MEILPRKPGEGEEDDGEAGGAGDHLGLQTRPGQGGEDDVAAADAQQAPKEAGHPAHP
jgi:hypothetical protein